MAMYVCPVSDTFDESVIAYYRDAAGEGLKWDTLRGGVEQGSKIKRLIRGDVAERQGYVCPQCGVAFTQADMDSLRVEALHIVAQRGYVAPGTARPDGRGWFPGNVMVGHKGCNANTAPAYDAKGNLIGGKEILDLADIARPDLVALEWTPLPALKRAAGMLK